MSERIYTGDIRLNPVKISSLTIPSVPTVNWNPEEYCIEYIDLEKGEIKFVRLDVKTNE